MISIKSHLPWRICFKYLSLLWKYDKQSSMPDIFIKYMDNQSNLLFNDFCKRQMRTGVTFLKTKHMHTCTHTSRMCFEKEKQGPDDRHSSGTFRQLYFLTETNKYLFSEPKCILLCTDESYYCYNRYKNFKKTHSGLSAELKMFSVFYQFPDSPQIWVIWIAVHPPFLFSLLIKKNWNRLCKIQNKNT